MGLRSWYRHKMIHQLSWKDVSRFFGSIPTYLRHPTATVNQIKRLFNV